MRLLIAVVAAFLALGAQWSLQPAHTPSAQAQWPAAQVANDLSALHVVERGEIPMPAGAAAAHASNLLAMPAGSAAALTAFWFAGDRESAPNVQIAASQWDRASRQWSPARFVVNRETMGKQLGFGVRRLGNSVAWLDGQNRIHLFVVATGWGGWAASRIVHLRQSNTETHLEALLWEPVRTLPLSWLWNTSFLVRNAPLALADGGMVLPVHFELGWKHPVALRFDQDGEFVGMERMSRTHNFLQPTVLMQSPLDWLALLRDQRPNGQIGVVRTTDGGAHWSDLPDLNLPNPDAAVSAIGLAPGQMLLAHNPSTESRTQLDLSQSADGAHWTTLATLDQGVAGTEFSYPAMAWVDGSLWLSYTQNRQRIAWQRLAAPLQPARGKP
jgi:predicted neuraminidase